jgi:hypothetical protein
MLSLLRLKNVFIMNYYKSITEQTKISMVCTTVYFFASALITAVLYVYIGLIGFPFGAIIIFLGLILSTYKGGIEIDLEKKVYRNYVCVFGCHMGAWRELPKIKHVSVVKFMSCMGRFVVGEIAEKRNTYKLILAVEHGKRFIKLRTFNRHTAINEALKIGEVFDLPVYDCSSYETKWLR